MARNTLRKVSGLNKASFYKKNHKNFACKSGDYILNMFIAGYLPHDERKNDKRKKTFLGNAKMDYEIHFSWLKS